MKSSRYVCAATSTGAVDFLDPITLQVIRSWQAHTAKINSMDARNDFLITCGWSTRPYGHSPSLDTLAKVFDLKRLEQLAPISFHSGAAFVQIHPKMSTTSIICSQSGQIHVIDIMNAENVKMLHMTLPTSLVGLVMSPSGNVWALADQDNVVSLWGSPNNLQFCETSNPIEFLDEVTPLSYMSVDSDLTIGMPYYRDRLLSAWGNDLLFEVGRPPVAAVDVPPGARRGPGNIGYISPNTRTGFRNQVSHEMPTRSNAETGIEPKYLSDRTRISGNGESHHGASQDILGAFTRFTLSSGTGDIPAAYEELQIKYGGPRGVQDFDFG
ncbi:poly(A)-specific ribonuclease [Lecanora helva]